MQKIDSHHYAILKIIYSIVREDGFPLKYRIHPRELILRTMEDWSSIQSALTALENEGLITKQQSDTVYVSLTEMGLEMCRTSFSK